MKVIKAVLFWLASLTWGLPMTLVGIVCAIALLITGHRPHRFHYFVYFEVGTGWGGFEAGLFLLLQQARIAPYQAARVRTRLAEHYARCSNAVYCKYTVSHTLLA